MAQWAALRVSVFDFRTATSEMIFQDFTPMFQPMSIEKSKFTLRSQAFLVSVLRNYFAEALFFVSCPANFEVTPPLILSKRKAGITPGLRIKIQFF